MPWTISRQTAEAVVRAVEECLREGYVLTGYPSAKSEAARRLELDSGTLLTRLKAAKRVYNLEPQGPSIEEVNQSVVTQRQRLIDELAIVKNQLKESRRALVEASDIRGSVLNLTKEPADPISIPPLKLKKGRHLAEAAVLHLSDFHWGEVIDLDEMGGLNKYDTTIAGWRLLRCFETVVDLLTKHWTGPKVARVFVLLGGDMFSGDIHLELQKTNEAPMPRPVKELLHYLVKAFEILLCGVPDVPIEIISVPGNHGRSTLKPQAKQYVATNFDSLLSDLLEWHFKTVKGATRLRFYRPESGDALFKVFDYQFLATHGDRIGSKGGQGFVGPAATIARGMKKIVDEYAASRVFVDQILVGHFHTSLRLEHGWSNGCLCGPNEYSAKMLRARPKAATQNFFQVHPERGITVHREIQVGRPDEGSLYQQGEGHAAK